MDAQVGICVRVGEKTELGIDPRIPRSVIRAACQESRLGYRPSNTQVGIPKPLANNTELGIGACIPSSVFSPDELHQGGRARVRGEEPTAGEKSPQQGVTCSAPPLLVAFLMLTKC